jgi:hypothetical protein
LPVDAARLTEPPWQNVVGPPGVIVTTGVGPFTVTTAEPVPDAEQYASVTVAVYVLVEVGETVRVTNEPVTALNVTPSDHTTENGAVPVKSARITAEPFPQYDVEPLTTTVGRGHGVSITIGSDVFEQPVEFVTVTV